MFLEMFSLLPRYAHQYRAIALPDSHVTMNDGTIKCMKDIIPGISMLFIYE